MTTQRENQTTSISAKRISLERIQLLREGSLLYADRKVRSPADAEVIFRRYLGRPDRECLAVLTVNVKQEPTSLTTAHIGTFTESVLHPREVAKTAVLHNAQGMLLCHYHPSDDATPSADDIRVTKRLEKACQVLGIKLQDHLILGKRCVRRSTKKESSDGGERVLNPCRKEKLPTVPWVNSRPF
ncbi:JAB domain-containing protein [Alkalicoccus urumqiensis]|uniref:DNA repair protein RadC n=1 Tax=Alkalicoccus urumqiensis TaxID=1548213 RepID=A0A2P6MHQ7_ALKUR|nr:JAB domain-containing protein [Alkalicoccus urumqiensis]PRO65817.1 DNA repair protein RadC [Alkalicoccus urumqiensis]